MPVSDFFEPFSFDALTGASSSNFLALLQNPGNYSVTQASSTLWVATLNSPSSAIARVEFTAATTFTPGGPIPSGLVGEVRVYDSAGDLVARFSGLQSVSASIVNLIQSPQLLVAANDDFLGSAGSDMIHLGAGHDLGGGADGDDQIFGGTGNDLLYDDADAFDQDMLFGEEGNDFLIGSHRDTLNGGSGFDTAVVSFIGTAGITLDLSSYTPGTTLNLSTGGSLVSIELIGLVGSEFADALTLGAWNGFLDGRDGNDMLAGGAGNDELHGGDGDDIVFATGGDIWDGGNGRDEIYLSYASSTSGRVLSTQDSRGFEYFDIIGSAFNDDFNVPVFGRYAGGAGNDRISASAASSTVLGEAGNDILGAGGNNVSLQGGSGDDTLSVSNFTLTGIVLDGGDGLDLFEANNLINTPVNANLETGANNLNVTLLSIERMRVFAGMGADTLIGGAGNDELTSGASADIVDGGAGNDTISDNDFPFGGDMRGIDHISGGAGDDLIDIYASVGDIIDGGAGNDTATVRMWDPAFSGVTVDLSAGITPGLTILNIEILSLRGSSGADLITGSANNDNINGDDGDDVLRGGLGVDALEGARGNDTIYGEAGSDNLNGHEGNDTIFGGDGDDVIFGDQFAVSPGLDHLYGGAGNDRITDFFNIRLGGALPVVDGGDGDDILTVRGDMIGGAGADTLIGVDQGSLDRASYTTSATGLTVVAGAAGMNTGDAVGDTFSKIEIIAGSNFSDTLGIVGTPGVWMLEGLAGNDTLFGGVGNETFAGGEGFDTIDGGAGADAVSGADDQGAIFVQLAWAWARDGWGHEDRLTSIENIQGSIFSDVLIGWTGSNNVSGGGGHDWIEDVGDGNDVFHGDDGNDIVWGGIGNDQLFGDGNDDALLAGAGNDTLDGGTGNDWVYAGLGADTITGGSGDDILFGAEGGGPDANTDLADTMSGGDGNDALIGEGGNDSLDAGTGNDWVYGGTGDDTIFGRAGNDVLAGEDGNDVITGEDGDDFVFGALGDDIVNGGAGNDWVDGSFGNDVITGGMGADSLFGGGGDRFVYTATAESTEALADVIGVFWQPGGDRIDVSAIDANNFSGDGDSAFVIVSAFSGFAGQAVITYDGTNSIVRFYINGDSLADMAIVVLGVELVAGDFIL